MTKRMVVIITETTNDKDGSITTEIDTVGDEKLWQVIIEEVLERIRIKMTQKQFDERIEV